MIDYSPFWKTLKETGVTQYDLIYHHNISRGTIHRMRKNKPLTLVTVDILCSILEVPIEKIGFYKFWCWWKPTPFFLEHKKRDIGKNFRYNKITTNYRKEISLCPLLILSYLFSI